MFGCRRNGVQPDERLYATLMGVAGAASNLELAFSLQDEMLMDGLRPSKVCFASAHANLPTPDCM